MKAVKITLAALAILLLLVLSYLLYFRWTHLPNYSDELSFDRLEKSVEVYFTEYGVPHIYAYDDEDAYFALGYVHAMERLWQMDFLRRVGGGRLSELFGPDLLKADKYLRTLGLAHYAKQSAADYMARDHESKQLVLAYIDGINTFVAENPKPLEHTMLGIDVEPFDIENVFEVITYMAFSFAKAAATDPVVTELSNRLDSTYLIDLQLYHYEGETVIPTFDDRYSKLTADLSQSFGQRIPEFTGSNSWVLSGSKTKSGKVILANDPHIAFAQPAVWYEAHLITPSTEHYGYFLAGSPFPPLLHTPAIANGLTMLQNDNMDFFVEEVHPEDSNAYRHDDSWKTMTSRIETIRVKDNEDVQITVRSTVHGPVVSDVIREEPLEDLVSMYWVLTDQPNYILEANYGFTRTASIDEMEQHASRIHGPGLNVMFGDSAGNVAWWGSAKLVQRADERASKAFYDGSNAENDITSFYPFEKNPHTVNPPWGYVMTANNQPDTVDGVVYAGYYLPDDRAERIIEILDASSRWDTEDVKRMTMDSYSKTFENIKPILLFAVKDTDESELLAELIPWQHTFEKDDFRPTVYAKWLYEILEAAMKDEMGEDLWEAFKKTHTYKIAIEHLLSNEKSKWWNNDSTEVNETRTTIIRQAFDKSIADLRDSWDEDFTEWRWGNVHTLTHNHAMGPVLDFLNVGKFGVSGGNEVINNLGFTYSGEKELPILFGPSTRRIVDFSDIRNNSWSVLPTGQSGNYFSPHYDDQVELYNNGEFRKMMMNEEEIKSSQKKLIFKPSE